MPVHVRTASVRVLEKKAHEASGFAAFVRHPPPADRELPIERDGHASCE